MAPRKYNPLILAYCRAHGIEVRRPFDRHPAKRFAVVRLDRSPPRLSAKTFFKKEDLHYYIRSNMRELGVTDGGALPIRVLDFADGVHLTITSQGDTRPGEGFEGLDPAQNEP